MYQYVHISLSRTHIDSFVADNMSGGEKHTSPDLFHWITHITV